MEQKLKSFEYYYGNPKYGWDGGRVTAFILELHSWRIENEPWAKISQN